MNMNVLWEAKEVCCLALCAHRMQEKPSECSTSTFWCGFYTCETTFRLSDEFLASSQTLMYLTSCRHYGSHQKHFDTIKSAALQRRVRKVVSLFFGFEYILYSQCVTFVARINCCFNSFVSKMCTRVECNDRYTSKANQWKYFIIAS